MKHIIVIHSLIEDTKHSEAVYRLRRIVLSINGVRMEGTLACSNSLFSPVYILKLDNLLLRKHKDYKAIRRDILYACTKFDNRINKDLIDHTGIYQQKNRPMALSSKG